MKLLTKIILFSIAFVVGFGACYFTVGMKNHYSELYEEAVSFLEAGDYDAAIDKFEEIPNYTQYRDVSELLINHKIDVCPNCGHALK